MRRYRPIMAIIALFALSAAAQTAGDLLEQCEGLYKDGDYRSAVEACGRSLEKDPRSDAAFNRRGWSRWKLKIYDEALADFDAAVRLNSSNKQACLGRSNVLYNMKRYNDAVKAADAAIQLDPNYSSAYVARGLARQEMGDLAGAERDCEKALELNPKNATALTNLGYLRRKAGDYRGAIEFYDRAIAIKPDHIDAHLNRGAARSHLGDLDGAIADASWVIDLDPKDADAWSNRGSAHLKKGDYASARRDLEKALALKPGHANAAAKLKELGDKGKGKGTVPAAKKRVTFGDFSIETVDGWERAPAAAEKEEKRWSFADLTSLSRGNDAAPLMAAFSFENSYYGSDEERDAILERYAATVRKAHPRGFAVKADILAGLSARRLRFLSDDGTAAFFYAVDAGDKVHYVQIYAQDAGEDPPKRARELLSTLLIEGSPAMTAGGAGTSAAPPVRTGGGLPLVAFTATDPCAAAAAAPDKGMPWSGAGGGSTAPPPPAPLYADLVKLSKAQYNGAVSMAMEGMRLLYGPMSPEDDKAFQSAWVPLYDHPNQEILGYLDKLTPLLAEFLTGRESWMGSASALQAAFLDGSIAVAADAKDAWREAMDRVERQTAAMRALEEKLASTARALQALGNPPNPLAAKCAAAGRYRRSLPKPESALDGEWISSDGKSRMHYKTLIRHSNGMALVYMYSYEFADKMRAAEYNGSKPGIENTQGGGLMAVPGREDTLFLCVQEPTGVLWAAPMDISNSLHAYFIEGDRLRHITYGPRTIGGSQYAFSGITYFRVPPLADKPPVLPGHRWEDIVSDAEKYEPGRLERIEKVRRNAAEGIRALLAVDPDNLPHPPIVRNAWDEGPHRADEKPPDCKCHVCRGGDGSECPCNLCREDRKRLGRAEGPEAPVRTADGAKTPAADPKAQQAVKETIDFHQSMVELLKRNLDRELAEMEREKDPERRKQLALRAIQLQSNIQAEQDLVASYKTGTLVHTRSAFDEFAHQQFLGKVNDGAQVGRVVRFIDRQIELLPPEQRKAAREQVHRTLNAGIIADGDLARARRLAEALDNQVQGYWAGVSAKEEEKAIAAEESEFYAQMVIMASSACVVGFGSQAAVEAFGAEAFLAQWAPNIIGGVYGGTTGFIAGGLSPMEGAKGALSNVHTVGGIAVNFADGYWKAKENKGTSDQDAAWEGAKQAGFNYLMEKGFEIGAKFLVNGSLHVFGKESALFRPIKVTPAQRDLGRSLRMTKDLLEAQDLVDELQLAQRRLMDARVKNPNAPEIAQLEAEARKLAAACNSSYHAKWVLKYKSHRSVQRAFDGHIQDAYEKMMPQMLDNLRSQGYDTAGLEFQQLRNASSAGTASMDLDLALKERPGMVILKNGRPVELAEFQGDAQKAMNRAYHSVTGHSAPRAELNLTTSVHGEAFSNPALLKKNVDFTAISPEDLAQIGAVLKVKLDKIAADPVLSPIAKVQASSRESSKEVKNMLLPMLKQKLDKAPRGSPEAAQLKADIAYWEEMLRHFNEIGTQATDPMRILDLDRLIRQNTGGKGIPEVALDLTKAFAGR